MRATPRAAVGRALLIVTVVIWGWSFVATKICLQALRPVEVIGLRFAIAIPVLALLAWGRGARIRRGAGWRGVALGSLVLAVHFIVQVTGLQYTSAVRTGWIIAVTPLVIALLARLALAEPFTRRTALGIALATLGILLLVSGGRLDQLVWEGAVGDWLVLLSAHTWALYTVVVRNAARAQDPLVLTLAVMTPVALVTLAATVASDTLPRLAELPLDVVGALAFLGVMATALAHWFWQEGVARVGASQAGLFLYLEPLATTALAVPLLREPVGLATLGGGLMVLGGVAVAQHGHRATPGPLAAAPSD